MLQFHENNLRVFTSTEIILKRLTDAESLTPSEMQLDDQRLTLSSSMAFRYWENVHYQYRNGMYDEDEFQAQKRAWRKAMTGDTTMVGAINQFADDWPKMKDNYSSSFVALVDSFSYDQAM